MANRYFISDREDAKNPRFWSRVCLCNVAKLAKEATTLFRYFDNGNLWSPQYGLALPVLLDMELLIEKFGIQFYQQSQKLLSFAVFAALFLVPFHLSYCFHSIYRAKFTLFVVHLNQAP